jgi:hypothetical protein
MKVIDLKNKLDLGEVVNKENEAQTEELPIINEPITDSYTIPEEVLTPEEVKEKRKLIIHIKNYLKEFPDALSEFKRIDFNGSSIDQLNKFMDEIKLTVCHSNSGGLFLGLFHGSCDLLESTAPLIKWDLTGLKYIASKNPMIINSVKELILEYQNLNYIPPDKRLALMMVQMCYTLNNVNKVNNKIEDKLNKTLPDELTDKYNEL